MAAGIQPPAQHPASGLFLAQHLFPVARAIVAHVRAGWISPGAQTYTRAAVKAPRQLEPSPASGKAGHWPRSIIRRGQGSLPLQAALAPFRSSSAWMTAYWPAVSVERHASADQPDVAPAQAKPARSELDDAMIQRVIDASAREAPAALDGKEFGVGIKVEISVDDTGHLQCALLDAEPLALLQLSREMWHDAADAYGPLTRFVQVPVASRSSGRTAVWRLAGSVREARITVEPMIAEALRPHTWPKTAKESKSGKGFALADRDRLAESGFGEAHLAAVSRWASGLLDRVLSRLDLDAEPHRPASGVSEPASDDEAPWWPDGEEPPPSGASQKPRLALSDMEANDMEDWLNDD